VGLSDGRRRCAKDVKIESGKINLVLTPVEGNKQAIVKLFVQCNDKQIPVKLSLNLSSPPKAESSVPVKIVK
jgi:hypothetical protein